MLPTISLSFFILLSLLLHTEHNNIFLPSPFFKTSRVWLRDIRIPRILSALIYLYEGCYLLRRRLLMQILCAQNFLEWRQSWVVKRFKEEDKNFRALYSRLKTRNITHDCHALLSMYIIMFYFKNTLPRLVHDFKELSPTNTKYGHNFFPNRLR